METFVVTHAESYGFSNLDAMAMGMRILTPPNFLCKGLQSHFDLPTFNSNIELITKIKEPIELAALNDRIKKMTDYSDIVKIIDKKCRQLILTEEISKVENSLLSMKKELEETKL